MREEQNLKMRDYMIDYLISVLDDSQDFSWAVTKNSHAVLLCRMEQGETISNLTTASLSKSIYLFVCTYAFEQF